MNRRNLEKKLKESWACPEGCDVSTSVCRHLEKSLELPTNNTGFFTRHRVTGKKARYIYLGDLSNVIPDKNDTRPIGEIEDEFRKYISKHLTNPLQIDILVDRFVYNKTFKRIAEDRNLVNRRASDAKYYFDTIMQILRGKLSNE